MTIEKNPDRSAFRIKQALIGWASEKSDLPILQYVDLIAGNVSLEAAFLLHVVRRFEELAPFEEEFTPVDRPANELGAIWVETMKQAVEKHVAGSERTFWEYEVREGDVLEELTLSAKDLQADLIFIGRLERSDRDAMLAPDLARVLPGHLWIVPGSFRRQLRRIVVGVDFSESSNKAFRMACQLANQWNEPAEILALHLYELPASKYLAGPEAMNDLAGEIRQNRESAFSLFLEKYRDLIKGATVSTEVRPAAEDELASTLCRIVRQAGADLVVLGAKGHSEVERLLLGSVAESVTRNLTDVPLLLVR